MISVEGEPTYPEKLTISSTGGTTETSPSVLGVYKRTNMTHSGRPVWQSTVRDDRYFFYNGININYTVWLVISIINNYFISRLVTLGCLQKGEK